MSQDRRAAILAILRSASGPESAIDMAHEMGLRDGRAISHTLMSLEREGTIESKYCEGRLLYSMKRIA